MKVIFIVAIFTATAWATCPNSAEAPKLSVRSQGITLLVCGNEEQTTTPKGKLHMSEFSIHSVDAKKITKEIFVASALDHYWVSKTKNSIVLEELWWIKNNFVPALNSTIACKKGSCSQSLEKCVLKVTKNLFPNSLAQLEKRVRTEKFEGEPYLDTMIGEVFAQGLGGDRKAQDFFLQENRPEWLDGANSEEWDSDHNMLERAQKLGCLKN